jgi:hypothetical protein
MAAQRPRAFSNASSLSIKATTIKNATGTVTDIDDYSEEEDNGRSGDSDSEEVDRDRRNGAAAGHDATPNERTGLLKRQQQQRRQQHDSKKPLKHSTSVGVNGYGSSSNGGTKNQNQSKHVKKRENGSDLHHSDDDNAVDDEEEEDNSDDDPSQYEALPSSPYKTEFITLWSLTFPIWITYLMEFSISGITVVVTGHLGTTELNAAAIGSLLINTTTIAPVIFGLTAALDTLATQAYTSSNPKTTSLYVQRTAVLVAACMIPCIVLLSFGEHIFLALRQDEEVARLAGQYVRGEYEQVRPVDVPQSTSR